MAEHQKDNIGKKKTARPQPRKTMTRQQVTARKKRKRRGGPDRRTLLLTAALALLVVVILITALVLHSRKSGSKVTSEQEATGQERELEGTPQALPGAGLPGSPMDLTAVSAPEVLQEETDPEEALEEIGTSQEASIREPVSIKVSVVGDCTLGMDATFDYSSSFNAYYDNYGAEYFLRNVKPIFEVDDLTVANCETTLTTATSKREDTIFQFKADPEYAEIFTEGSVEAVTTANNHSHDYLEQGYTDTIAALDEAGVVNVGYEKTAVMDVKGVKVGLVGIYEIIDHLGCADLLETNINKVRQEGAELVIVIFHWGNELDTEPDSNQTTLGRLAVDLGADLVCGHHAHVLQGIENYKGVNICYGLGNFCFGGNTAPRDMDTIIFQQTFTITEEGVARDNVTNIIPCSISSAEGYNNYQPTPATGEEASRILRKLRERTALM